MNDTIKAVLRILEQGTPELRIAAAQVLGELRVGDTAVVQALSGAVERSEDILAPFAVDALAKIGTASALGVLVRRLTPPGALADRVALGLVRAGAAALPLLTEAFTLAGADTQIRILGILAKNLQKEALALVQKALFAPDRGVAERAADIIQAALGELSDGQRKNLVESIGKVLGKDGDVSPEVQGRLLRLLTLADASGAKALLLRMAQPKQLAAVRVAAIEGLRKATLTAAQAEQLLAYLEETDPLLFEPLLATLEAQAWGAGVGPRLRRLLDHEREDVRLFALRALRHAPGPDLVKPCLQHLSNGSPAFRDAACGVLAQLPAALDGVMKAFQGERNPERARAYGQGLVAMKAHVKKAMVRAMAEKASKALSAGEPLGVVAFETLQQVAPEESGAAFLDKALRLRRARRWDEALQILLRLAQAADAGTEARYQLALTRLLADQSRPDLAVRESGDATMGHFARLVREGFPLIERLRKEGQVTPDALLRIGRHFAEAAGQERRFGAEMLQFVATRHGRGKAGEEARQMLRTAHF